MTLHTYRSTGPVKGCRTVNKRGKPSSPRITVSFNEKDFAQLTKIAAKLGIPVSALVRYAVKYRFLTRLNRQ